MYITKYSTVLLMASCDISGSRSFPSDVIFGGYNAPHEAQTRCACVGFLASAQGRTSIFHLLAARFRISPRFYQNRFFFQYHFDLLTVIG